MGIISDQERARLLALGVEGLKREIGEGKQCQPGSPHRDAIDDLLQSMEAEEESKHKAGALQVAGEANRIAREANTISRSQAAAAWRAARYSMYAAVVAVVAALISISEHILALIFGK